MDVHCIEWRPLKDSSAFFQPCFHVKSSYMDGCGCDRQRLSAHCSDADSCWLATTVLLLLCNTVPWRRSLCDTVRLISPQLLPDRLVICAAHSHSG